MLTFRCLKSYIHLPSFDGFVAKLPAKIEIFYDTGAKIKVKFPMEEYSGFSFTFKNH